MDAEVRDFIASATLLFIASRSVEGTLDVSPRGGQPSVLWPDGQGRLLLPDYMGNRRLDTIGNLIANPEVVIALLARGENRFLKIRARAQVSMGESDVAMFPADQNRPTAAIVLTPHALEFVETEAFARAGFWLDPSERKAPLDMLGYYHSDKAMHRDAGRGSVPKPAVEEALLVGAGIREIYGTPSEVVRTKVYDAIGPGGIAFIDEACFIALASDKADGGIELDLLGGEPLVLDEVANRQSFRLRTAAEPSASAGQCALVAAVPGRCEALRMNGPFRAAASAGDETLTIAPDEIFFHCSAALTRSRIWAESRPAAWTGLRRFRVAGIRQESPDVRSLVLTPCDAAPIGDILAGQYVTIALPQDTSQPQRRRNYSISGQPGERTIRISVRKIAEDGLSGLLHTLVVGDDLQAGVPTGRFLLASPPGRPVVLVSAGVGITPLLPMLKALAEDCVDRDVTFIHAARDARHALFADEARALAERSADRVRLFTAYSRASDDDVCDHHGRLDANVIAGLVQPSAADFYICGPGPFMASLRGDLIAMGAAPEAIHVEAFGSSGDGMAEALAGREARTITFASSGKAVIWRPDSGTLLDLALGNRINVPYSCRNGDCQSCVQKLVSGSADYPLGEAPVLAEGQVLMCQAAPRTDLVIAC